MTDVTEEMLAAYADGELDEINRRRVERAVAQDQRLASTLAAHERLRTTLAGHYGPIAGQAVPDRFSALIAIADADVVSLSGAREKARARILPGWMAPTAIAASLLLGLALGRGLDGDAGPVSVRGGQMVAQGELAHALDIQLASAQDPESSVRIGITFQSRDGNWCRSFTGASLSGIACRSTGGWRLEQAISGGTGRQAQYRQASSGDPRIMMTVDSLIAGEALGARDEKAARDAGWTQVKAQGRPAVQQQERPDSQ